MDPKDIELLPDNQVDPALAKLLGKKSNMPVWLRNTEYTELPLRQEGLEGVLRTRRRTLQEKPVPEILDSTVHVGDNETLEQVGTPWPCRCPAVQITMAFSDCTPPPPHPPRPQTSAYTRKYPPACLPSLCPTG